MEHKGKVAQSRQRLLFEPDLERASDMLRQGSMVLMPSDSIWVAAVSVAFAASVERLMSLAPEYAPEEAEVLVKDIAMLKSWAPALHPRIETLLMHHIRPVAIYVDTADQIPFPLRHPKGGVVFRVSLDVFVQHLIEKLGTPLATLPILHANDRVPVHFGGISSAHIQQMDYVVKYRQQDRSVGELPVLVRLGPDEELEFYRE